MSVQIRELQYRSVMLDRANTSSVARVLRAAVDAGVELTAASAFPRAHGRFEIDLIGARLDGIDEAFDQQGWKLSRVRRLFSLQAGGGINSLAECLDRLSQAGVEVISTTTETHPTGATALIWVEQDSIGAAAEALQVDPHADAHVDESSEESFPASDPPSFSPTALG